MIVICKPASPTDATNTGYMDKVELGAAIERAYNQFGWYAGVKLLAIFFGSERIIHSACCRASEGTVRHQQGLPMIASISIHEFNFL
jgi:hypothetical protein